MTKEQKLTELREYRSVIISCELAAQFNKDKPNKAIKACLKKCRSRVSTDAVKQVCTNGITAIYVPGWLALQKNRIARIAGVAFEDLVKI